MSGADELVERARHGDRNAFRAIVDEHRRRVFNLAYDLTGTVEDAEDLSQEAFLKLYRSLGAFRGDCSVATWLRTITMNLWIERGRARNAKLHRALSPLDDETADSRLSLSETSGEYPERSTERSLIRGQIDTAMAKLSPRERSVLVLRFFNDLKLSEISETLAISEGAVKSHLFKAMKKMRKRLAFLAESV